MSPPSLSALVSAEAPYVSPRSDPRTQCSLLPPSPPRILMPRDRAPDSPVLGRPVSGTNFRLHGARSIDHDEPPGRRRQVERFTALASDFSHFPNARSAPAKASSADTSPTMARIALFGPNQVL